MMLTIGGPKLRSLGREVANYDLHGAAWEDVDSGLLLLVCAVIKLAALQPSHAAANERLRCAEAAQTLCALRGGFCLLTQAAGSKDPNTGGHLLETRTWSDGVHFGIRTCCRCL